MNKNIKIRQLKKEDNNLQDEIIRMLEKPRDIFPQGMIVEPSYKDKEQLGEIFEMGYSFGAFENDKLVGFVIASYDKVSLKIYDIVVDKYLREGIGQGLINKVMEQGDKNKIAKISLCTDTYNYKMVKLFCEKYANCDIFCQNNIWINMI